MYSPSDIGDAALVIGALSLFGLLIRQIGPWRRQIDEMEERLRTELRAERTRCEAELRVVKHRERASRQMIYSLLHLFDLPAARRKEMLVNIRADLAIIEQAEALESGLVSTAGIGEPEGSDE